MLTAMRHWPAIKWRHSFGAQVRDLSDPERQELQRNRGVCVTIVVDGSPAYDSDILPGDVIVAVDGVTVDGVAGLRDAIAVHQGQSINVAILRQGKSLSKSVTLGD